MVDIHADIISGKAIGNISLGSNIIDYEFYNDPEFNESLTSSDPEVTGDVVNYYDVNDGIYISTDIKGFIFAIGCNDKYKGKYKNKLYAGVTMGEVVKSTTKQRILNGTLIFDDDYGISFTLPSPYDEIADYIEHIPHDLKLNEIYVSDYSFWKNN